MMLQQLIIIQLSVFCTNFWYYFLDRAKNSLSGRICLDYIERNYWTLFFLLYKFNSQPTETAYYLSINSLTMIKAKIRGLFRKKHPGNIISEK